MDARLPARHRSARSVAAVVLALGLLGGAGLLLRERGQGPEPDPPHSRPPLVEEPALPPASEPGSADAELRPLPLPSGAAVGISCEAAHRASAFLSRELATPAIEPLPSELAPAWAALLDPHGLWAAAPDSPLASELSQAAPDMLASLYRELPGCAAAERVAGVFASWTARLAREYDAAFALEQARPPRDADDLFTLLGEPLFEDDPVTRSGAELARELGTRLGAFVARFPGESALAERARARFFPSGPQELADIVTLAALRAYVPLVDPHGDFAPLDEEWALYAGDVTLDGGTPLWADVVRTPLGARVVASPAAPLAIDDLVLAIDGLSLAGASVDQIEQAARSAPSGGRFELRVLRRGEPGLLSLSIAGELELPSDGLHVERIRSGRAGEFVLYVEIRDVGDWLGDELAGALADDAATAQGVLLDLRGNGGGSLDAAVEVLGQLLPGE
ncbi:MAG TPA: S41 family peptidase, partial [Polyangiaceae bacterium]